MSYLLRFGPLAAAFALGLAVVLEPFFPGYTGILNSLLSILGIFGVQPDQAVVGHVGDGVAGVLALIGVGRKLYSLVKPYFVQ